MTYGTCPSCGIRLGSRDGIGPTRCPRCLARKGLSVVRTPRAQRLRAASSEPDGLARPREAAPASGTWSEHGPLSIRTERDPTEVYIVEFYGELDLAGTEAAATELRRCEETDVEEIIVDLSRLDFIDSSGLQVLVESFKRDRQNGNRLRFLRGPDPVQRVIELTCLDAVLPFAD